MNYRFLARTLRFGVALAGAGLCLSLVPDARTQGNIAVNLVPVGSVAAGNAGATGAAEIPAYDPATRRVFVVNNPGSRVDVINISNPAAPTIIGAIELGASGLNLGSPNSVAVRNGVLAIAIEATNRQSPGTVAFFNAATLAEIPNTRQTVGSIPDNLVFSPNGQFVLTANEGEPNSYNQAGSVDPEGSVNVIRVAGTSPATFQVTDNRTAGFTQFNGQAAALRASGVRIFGPNATVAQDLEPEYITVSPDNTTAYVTVQEANAVAVVNLATAAVTGLRPLGLKDFSVTSNSLDASDEDGPTPGSSGTPGPTGTRRRINLQPRPVFGMYQPDAIASYTAADGQLYYVTANEGDSRDYPGFNEEVRVGASGYVLDPAVFPDAAALKNQSALGRLVVTNQDGNLDADTQFERIQTLGGRSFSIWRASDGTLVFDSGNQFEVRTQNVPTADTSRFNSDGTAATFDTRSDNKGPEPEGVVVSTLFGRVYAFIGLERTGGVMVYDVTNPAAPSFVDYENRTGDVSPEGLLIIDRAQSPNRRPLLVVTNEVSGTTTLYEIVQAR